MGAPVQPNKDFISTFINQHKAYSKLNGNHCNKRYILFYMPKIFSSSILLFLLVVGAFLFFTYYHFLIFLIGSCCTFNPNEISENDMEFNFDYVKLTKNLNLDINRIPAIPYISGETFVGLADYEIHNLSMLHDFNPKNVKSNDIVFVKTDYLDKFLKRYHEAIPNRYTLMTHNSAYSVGENIHSRFYKDPKIVAWFGQNMINKHPTLHRLPVALANRVWPHGNVTILKEVSRTLRPFHERKTLMYINFSNHTNPEARVRTMNYFGKVFGDNKNVYIAKNKTDWRTYLQQLGDTKFVVSPPGRGIDCLRTWESLMMGAVPIVLRTEISELYEDMPILVVKDWTEVTPDRLEKFEKEELTNTINGVPIRPKIWTRYWIEKILITAGKIKKLN